MYRDGMQHKTYACIYETNEKCVHCKNNELVIDLRGIAETSFQSGDQIIDDLKEYGWLNVQTPKLTREIYECLKDIEK